jgi:cytochrome P450
VTQTLEALPLYEAVPGQPSPDERFSAEDVAFSVDPIGYHLDAYRKHGPIYRIQFRNQEWVAIAGLEANDLCWTNADVWSYQKAMAGFGEELGYVHVTTLDGVPHRRKRRALSTGFRASVVFRHLPVMATAIAERFEMCAGQDIDIYEFCRQAIIYASSRTMVDTPLSEELLGHMADFEEKFMRGTNLGEFRHEYFAQDHYLQDKRAMFDYLAEVVSDRLAGNGESGDDNLDRVLQYRVDDDGYSMDEKLYDAYLLLVAGAENTTKLITWIMQYLSEAPEWEDELRDELEGWTPDAFLTGLGDFPKLQATIMEGERLKPGALFHSRVTATDLDVLGYELPADTWVLQVQALPHFLEEIYEDPFEFRPQRWLENNYPKKAHGTFGGGTHICLGKSVTRVHAPVVLANLIKDYRMELEFTPGFDYRVDLGGAAHREPMPARFIPRS